MYLEHFGLKEHPFRLTPDSEFLFMSEAHARAMSYMDYTVWNREGFVVITGEIGCGKTTLIQKLLAELDEEVLVAKIFQTQLDEVEFLQAVLVEFGMNPFNAKKVELMDMLNSYLVEQFARGKQIVLIVDDAHNLNIKVFEEIRMLAGLETRKEKILHVILVGQPQLNELLELPELEQLLQRVRLRYHIKTLSKDNVGNYVKHRLKVAGAADDNLFSADTYPLLFKHAGGVPRLLNALCDTALTVAYADGLTEITAAVVQEAVGELQWLPFAKRSTRKRVNIPTPTEMEIQSSLREQVRQLRTIANQLGKLEGVGPTLAAVSLRLAMIERHLRDMGSLKPMSRSSAPRGRKIN